MRFIVFERLEIMVYMLGLKRDPNYVTWLIKLNKHGYGRGFLYGRTGFYLDITSDGGYIIVGGVSYLYFW